MIQFCLPSGSSRFQTDNNDSADVIVSVTVSNNSDWMVCVYMRCFFTMPFNTIYHSLELAYIRRF